MRSEKLLTALLAVVIAFLVSFGCIGCVVTGFDMAVDLWSVALWCGVSALISGTCFALSLIPIPFCAAVITGGALWFGNNLELSLQAVIYRFSRKYNATYGWGVVRPLHYTADMLEPELWLCLCFLGAVLAMLVALAFCRRKLALPGILLTAACVASCFLVRETVPDTIWLWLFFFGFLLLLLTQTVRRTDLNRGNRLALATALPLAIFLLLLFAVIPQESYAADKPAKAVTDAVLQNPVFQMVFGDLTKKPGDVISTDTDRVRLDAVGPQYETHDEILRVEADFTGKLYLRSRSLYTYDSLSWKQKEYGGPDVADWPAIEGLEPLGTVRITTKFAHKMIYQPYYVQNMAQKDVGYVENKEQLTEYSFSVYKPPSESQLAALKTPMPEDIWPDYSGYSLKKQADKAIKGKETVYEKAQAIAAYVQNSATYDLQTPTMPKWEDNFVQWFLEDSDTGYCVHFASATAALLKVVGIPARYVNGYMVDVNAGEIVLVDTSHAHAWVEYWLPGFGWTVLESTPAAPDMQDGLASTTPHKTISGGAVALIAAVTVLVAFVAMFVQRWIRLHLRRKKLCSGSVKEQVLAYWQESVRFANCLEEAPGEGLLKIAERAKFSNHTMTPEDLEPFQVYLNSARQRIRNHSFFRKLYYRFVLALY